MSTAPVYDPFASAVEAGERPDQYFGEIALHVQFVNLQKGQRKEIFDAQIHDARNRRTEVEITILPLVESGLTNPLQRSVIAESAEWKNIVWPSLRALGVADGDAFRKLHGQFAAVEFATTGRKYTNKDGEERDSTTLKFTAIYPNEATATAAWRGERGGSQPAATNGNGNANGHTNGHTNGNGSAATDAERAAMAAFIPSLVKQANRDPNRLAEIFASNPMINKHFNVNSPEVVAAMSIPF